MSGEMCTRKRVVINDQNFYLVVGHSFVDITIAHENRPENLELRKIVEKICGEISYLMEAQVERNTKTINKD